MQRTFLIGLAGFAVLIVVAVIGFTFAGPGPAASHGPVVSTSTIQGETTAYKISIEYPQFGIPTIDTQIKKDVDDAVAEFKTLPANPPDSATPQNTFEGSFDSIYIGPDVVSAELILSQYTGGAHSMTIFSGVNFDRATGKLLLLDDVLPLIGKSVAQVSEESSAQFKKKFGDAFFADGASTNPENFSSFVISKDNVTFIFQQYQVAAYSAGPQRVSFARIK